MKKFNYGDYLRLLRKSKGISQEKLAFELLISQTTLSRIECSPERPSRDLHDQIQAALIYLSKGKTSNFKEIDYDKMTDSSASGLHTWSWLNLDAIIIRVVTFAFAMIFGSIGFEVVRGFCHAQGVSSETSHTASMIGGFVMMVVFYYWWNKCQKKMNLLLRLPKKRV